MFSNSSFAFRLNFVICALSLAGILAVISINSMLSHMTLEKEMRERSLPALVKSIETEITTDLEIVHRGLGYVARWPALAQWMQQGEPDETFPEIYDLCHAYATVYKTGYINIAVEATRHFYEAVGGWDKKIRMMDPVVDKWFHDFKDSGKALLTNLHNPADPIYGGMAFVNARVEDHYGHFLGSIGVPVDMSRFVESVRTKKIGKKGRTFIVRSNGLILMHTNPALVYKRLQDLPGFMDIPPESLTFGSSFFRIHDREGSALLVGVQPLEAMDAAIVTVVDADEFFKTITQARNYSLLAALAVLCLILFAGTRFSGHVTRSMRRIIDFAGRVARNEASEPFAHEGYQEMNEMADALNGMNLQLRQSNLSLESVGRIFDGLDITLMVTDPDTDEVLFSNARLNREFYNSGDPRGEKCWKVMYPNRQTRCRNCPLQQLKANPGAFTRNQVSSPETKRLYEEINSFIDWTGGKKAMLIQRVDITEAAEARKTLKIKLAQQALALSISQTLFSTEPTAKLIANAVQKTGAFLNFSRLRISRHNEELGALVCEYEWRNPDNPPPPMLGTAIPYGPGHPLHSLYAVKQLPYAEVCDIADMPGLLLLPKVGVKAFIDAPIYVSGKLWGIIGADDCTGPRQWKEDDIHLLRIIAGILSGLLFRRAAEDKMLRMSSLIEEATQYITYVNKNEEFQYFNRSTCTLLGYSPEDLSAGGLSLIFSKQTMEHVRATILPAIIIQGRLSFELPVVRKDGAARIFSFEAFAVGSGDDVGIGTIGLDVTEKRRLEDELLRAKEEAEQSSRAKSAFLSRMSHEMRTPLNAVLGMAGIAQKTDNMERRRGCLSKINDAATHLLGMINEILDVSYIEADNFVLRTEPFSFEAMIGKTTDPIGPQARDKQLHFTVDIDPAIPPILYGDGQRLGQAVGSLLHNAVKFTPEKGRASLSARLLEERDQDCLLAIAVSDSGQGIPEDKRDLLFKPFEQIDGGDARKFGGAGLGLALAHKIIRLMGGEISFDPGREGGSVFTIRLRLRKEAPADATSPDQTGPPPQAPEPDRAGPEAALPPPDQAPDNNGPPPALPDNAYAGRRILLADDVEINREIVMALLEHTGIAIDCAEDGQQAVDMFLARPDRYCLIFMDINMPGVDGYAATAALRGSGVPQAQRVPIVAMTANAFDKDVRQCLDAGMNGHLAKPIMPDKLMAALAEHLGPAPDKA